MGKKNINVGMCFSKKFEGDTPLNHIDIKLPTYLRFFDLCKNKGWGSYVLTRKTYEGNGFFNGVWEYFDEKFKRIEIPVKIDLVYDRSAGVSFPPKGDESVIWVNNIEFKVLAWDKWKGYGEIGEYMPKTFLVESEKEVASALPQIKTDWVVLKPFNGLKGIGVFIGPKEKSLDFKFPKNYPKYIAQEFVDTSCGIFGIVPGMHDLRVVIVNGKVVWCHVRQPVGGSFLANAAQGGNLTEVDYAKVPESVKIIVEKVTKQFFSKFENPIYSLDFGIGDDGTPKIFEINDQIGFPKWEMKNRDNFLNAIIDNFSEKLEKVK